MKLRILFFSIIFVQFIHCKQESSPKVNVSSVAETNSHTSGDSTIPHPANVIQMTPEYIVQLNKQAESILNFRRKNNPVSDAIVDVGVWEIEMTYQDAKMSKPGEHKGKWIDFDEKGNYEYGLNSDIQGSGKYHYDNNTSLLIMVDNDKSIKPKEYELKFAGSIMIMMGKQTYQDNNYQAKLVKVAQRPK